MCEILSRWRTATTHLLLACVAIVSGCGRQSTLYLRDGTIVSGAITDGHDGYVHVETRAGETTAVPRRNIGEVDYPGTAAIIVGASLVVAGAVAAYAIVNTPCDPEGRSTCGEQQVDNETGAKVIFALFAIPGASIGAYGFVIKAIAVDQVRFADRPRSAYAPQGLAVQAAF